MPLVFNKSLNQDNWINAETIPSKSLMSQYSYFFNTTSGNTFKKLTPVLDQVIFDRESKHDLVVLNDKYTSCSSGTENNHKAIGIKTLPIKDDMFQLFTIKVKSVNNGSPMIGFCDRNKIFEQDKLNHCIMWNIHESFIRYYYSNNIELSNKTFYINPFICKGDVLNIAVDRQNNLMWICNNYNWVNLRPNKLDTGVTFIPNGIDIEDPVLYIIPSGWELELIKYEKFKPSYYFDAVSLPVTDWYLVNSYEEGGLV